MAYGGPIPMSETDDAAYLKRALLADSSMFKLIDQRILMHAIDPSYRHTTNGLIVSLEESAMTVEMNQPREFGLWREHCCIITFGTILHVAIENQADELALQLIPILSLETLE
jgi:hypothetical protein